jgi:hypothetical protein
MRADPGITAEELKQPSTARVIAKLRLRGGLEDVIGGMRDMKVE